MLPNKKETITKVNKITIEAEIETEDKEMRSRIIEYTPIFPEGIHFSAITANAKRNPTIIEFIKGVKPITKDSPSFSLTIDSPVKVEIK